MLCCGALSRQWYFGRVAGLVRRFCLRLSVLCVVSLFGGMFCFGTCLAPMWNFDSCMDDSNI
jgi:hypothetical protein